MSCCEKLCINHPGGGAADDDGGEKAVIRNSFIRSFDDCIIARPQLGAHEMTPFSDMTVSNCVLWCDWGVNIKVQHGHEIDATSPLTTQICFETVVPRQTIEDIILCGLSERTKIVKKGNVSNVRVENGD